MKIIRVLIGSSRYWQIDQEYGQPDIMGFGPEVTMRKFLADNGYNFLSETIALNGHSQLWGKK